MCFWCLILKKYLIFVVKISEKVYVFVVKKVDCKKYLILVVKISEKCAFWLLKKLIVKHI